jgi:hypothetical protein
MDIIEVPQIDEEGNVTATLKIPAEQVQVLLQFALNFTAGIGTTVVGRMPQTTEDFDD